MELRIQLLGSPALYRGNVLEPVRHRRAILLLALLAVCGGRPVSRQLLAESIWQDATVETAAVNLRRALADLRDLLGTEAECLQSPSRQELMLCVLHETVQCDVCDFDVAARRFETYGDLRAAAHATDLYHGYLLDGYNDECLDAERRYRHGVTITMLETLARDALTEQGNPQKALRLCERIERWEAHRETALRLRIEAYLAQGNRAAADAAYHAFSEHSACFFGAEPSTQTAHLLAAPTPVRNALLQTRLPLAGASCAADGVRPADDGRLADDGRPAPNALIGRDAEQKWLSQQFALQPSSVATLVTVHGSGGTGKTALALVAATAHVAKRGSAAIFVNLASLSADASADAIYALIGAALGIADASEPAIRAFLRDRGLSHRTFLRDGRRLRSDRRPAAEDDLADDFCLLFLDNAEHLLPRIAFCVAMLLREATPTDTILVTSRVPLNVPGEKLLALAPLATDDAAPDAMRLFEKAAQSANPALRFDTPEAQNMARQICRRLDGLPLALELAAARLRSLPLAELFAQICAPSDVPLPLLSGGATVAPARQQSLTNTLDWSWSLLSPEQRLLLSRLALLRDTWTGDTANAVAGFAPLIPGAELMEHIAVLVNHSLIRVAVPPEGEPLRYRLFELVRTFALEKLSAQSEAFGGRGAVESRFAEWAKDFAQQGYNGLWSPDAARWTNRLLAEKNNLRAALDVANADTARWIAHGIDPLWWRQSRFREGLLWQTAARHKAEAENDILLIATARLKEEQFRYNLGEPHRARPAFATMIALVLERGDTETATYLLHSYAGLMLSDGAFSAAADAMHEGLRYAEAIAQSTGNRTLLGYQQRGVAMIACAFENYPYAETLCYQALGIMQTAANVGMEMVTLPWLGRALLQQKKHDAAEGVLMQTLRLCRENDSPRSEQEAIQLLGELRLATGELAQAQAFFDTALQMASTQDNADAVARAVCGTSVVLRAMGGASLTPTVRLLLAPGTTRLPFITLQALLTEIAVCADATGHTAPARLLRREIASAHAASLARVADGDWSPGLAVTRSRAAVPASVIEAAMR